MFTTAHPRTTVRIQPAAPRGPATPQPAFWRFADLTPLQLQRLQAQQEALRQGARP